MTLFPVLRHASRILAARALLATGGALLLPAGGAAAQSGGSMVFEDDGGGTSFIRFAGPDLRALREPDFRRTDLPLFRKTLRLSDEQVAVTERLITEYLESLDALLKEKLPSGPMSMHFGDSEDGLAIDLGDDLGEGAIMDSLGLDAEDGHGMVAVMIGAGGGDLDPAALEEMGAGEIGVDVDVTADAGGGEPGGAPMANVMIALDGPDGAEIPEEVRRQLEEKAQEMAERLRERMKQRMESGEGMGPGDGLSIEERIEEHKRRFAELEEAAEAIKTAKASLRQAFVIDAQTGLAPVQVERWPVLERALTRKRTLPRGRLDGEQTDLIEILDDLGVDAAANADLVEAVAGYERVLDDALRQRNRFLEDADRAINTALEEGRTDKALATVDQATKLRVAVRDTNHWFAEAIAQQLPDAEADRFRAAVREESFPRVFRTTRGDRAFEAVRRMGDAIDPDVRSSIAELESAYRREREAVDLHLVEDIRRHQPDEPHRMIERMGGGGGGVVEFPPGGEDPLRAAFGRRRALDARYIELVRGLLPPEQAARLPKPPSVEARPVMIQTSSGGPE